jgi:hypothetical protein
MSQSLESYSVGRIEILDTHGYQGYTSILTPSKAESDNSLHPKEMSTTSKLTILRPRQFEGAELSALSHRQ